MKSFLIFCVGFIGGIAATLFFIFIIATSNESKDGLIGLTIFPEKGDCIPGNQFDVFQVKQSNMALASSGIFPNDVTVLIINHDGKHYYDNQKIKIPTKQCARQIGTYEYTTMKEIPRNVPAVVIE